MRNRRRTSDTKSKRSLTLRGLETMEARTMLSADLVLTNMWDSGYNQYTPGVPIQYTITAENLGTTAVSGAQIADVIPSGFSFSKTVSKSLRSSSSTSSSSNLTTGAGGGVYQSGGSQIVWTLPTIQAGAKISVAAVLIPTTSSIAPLNPLNTVTSTATLTTPGVTNSASASQLTLTDTDSYQEAPNASSVSLQSSANPSVLGNSVTFAATVASGTGVTAVGTGTVQFYEGTTALGSPVTVTNGVATYTLTSLPVGTNSITASYSGDENYQPSTSAAVSQVVQSVATTPPTPVPVAANVSMTISSAVGTLQNPSQYVPGTLLTYTFNVTNSSTSLTGASTVTYSAPTGYSITAATAPTGDSYTIASNQIVFDLVNVASGVTQMSVTIYAAAPTPIAAYTTSNGNVTGPTAASGVNCVTAPVASPVLTLPSGFSNTSTSTSPTLTIPVPAYIVSMTDSITLPALTPAEYSYYAGTTEATQGQTCVAYTVRQLVNYYDSYINATSTQNGLNGAFNINLNGGTYTFVSSGSSKSDDHLYQLAINNPNNQGAGRALQISNGTINANHVSRAISVASQQNLYLTNVVIENGFENGGTSNASTTGPDALGGGVYVGAGGSLVLQGSTIENCVASGEAGIKVTSRANSTRAGVGYNAAGGGIYGAAGSSITIDGKSAVTGCTAIGGKGAAADSAKQTTGGTGGAAYGGGIAIDAPASGSVQTAPTKVSTLTIDGGASIANNRINRILNQAGTATSTYGATGGTITNGAGTGGTGGTAYGAGLYMYSGSLVLNGGSKLQAISVDKNYQSPGKGYSASGSIVAAGSVGNSYGVLYLEPGVVTVTNSPSSRGIFTTSGNESIVNQSATTANLYLPAPLTSAADAAISSEGVWNLRTAVTAANQLSASGMAVALTLASGTYMLSQGSLSITSSGSGSLKVEGKGTGSTGTFISGNNSSTVGSILDITNASFTLKKLVLENGAATASGDDSGGAILVANSKAGQAVSLVSVSVLNSKASTYGGGIYQSGGGLRLSNTNVTGCTSSSGAGLAVVDGCELSVSGGTIGSNVASSQGGGIYGSDAYVDLANVTVSSNKSSGGSGGGMSAIDTLVVLTDCIFSGNQATGNGGAVLVNGSSTLNVAGGGFTSNSASNGGAIAMSTQGAQKPSGSIRSAFIAENGASGNGGGVYQFKGHLKIVDSVIGGNTAKLGGGIAASSVTSGKYTSNQISSNSASLSSGGAGGGIYQSKGTLKLVKDHFQANSAYQGGGAQFVGGTTHVTDPTVVSNKAAYAGGGIAAVSDALKMTSGYATRNSVTGSATSFSAGGGGLFLSKGSIALKHFSANLNVSKGGPGAGIALAPTGAATFTTVHVYSNSLTSSGNAYGGGMFLSGGTLNANNSIVRNNTLQSSASNPTIEGGGVFIYGSTANFYGTEYVTGNNVILTSGQTGNGGGIAVQGGTLNIPSGATFNLWGNSVTTTTPTLTLTDNVGGEARSAWLKLAVNIASSFTASYTYTASGSKAADGIALAFQNEGTAALGGTGGDLGYVGITGATAAYEMNIYNGHTIGTNFVTTNTSMTYNSTGNVLLQSGDPINVVLTYNASAQTMTESLTDTVTNATYSHVYSGVNLESVLGSSTAYVGFTGGDGGALSVQTVSNFGGILASTPGSFWVVNSNGVETPALGSSANVTGTGGGIFFGPSSSYNVDGGSNTTDNSAVSAGNTYAFVVSNVLDNGIGSTPPSYSSGINYFTSGEGSLRNAVTYAQSYMNASPTNTSSIAIVLTSAGSSSDNGAGNYILDGYGLSGGASNTLSTSVAADLSLTIVGETGSSTRATIQGYYAQTMSISNTGALILQNLAIIGGDTVNQQNGTGGGIYQGSGVTVLNNVLVTNNYAGFEGTAANSWHGTATGDHDGKDGANGASGYGGGIYLGGGNLTLTSTSSITGNTVYGQNGAVGQKGANGHVKATAFGCKSEQGGQQGGDGGDGGSALGGGLYQTGGYLFIPSGSSVMGTNSASPGSGGAAGAGGSSASSQYLADKPCTEPGGSPGSAGSKGDSVAGYDKAGGSSIFTQNAAISAAVVTGGLYSSGGNLSAGLVAPAATSAASMGRLDNATVDLYSQDGTLIATTTTGSDGRFHFDTNWSGLGYIVLHSIPIFNITPMGTRIDAQHSSAVDSATGASGVVQFINGVAVDANLDIVLKPKQTNFVAGQNAIQLKDSDGANLWTDFVMPKTYRGGFKVVKFDYNGDGTSDYMLITKTGQQFMFLVDGRVGTVTRIRGAVNNLPLLKGVDIQEVDVAGPDYKLFVISPTGRLGKVGLLDPNSGHIVWTAKGWDGGVTAGAVYSPAPGQQNTLAVQLVSNDESEDFRILDTQTGEVIYSHTCHCEERAKMAPKAQTAKPAVRHHAVTVKHHTAVAKHHSSRVIVGALHPGRGK